MAAKKKSLLFLYMVKDTGHQQAADAVMKAAQFLDSKIPVAGVDAVSHAYPLIGNVFNRMYLEMLKRAPAIWDFLYDNPDIEAFTRDARSFLTFVSSFKTKKILRQYRPLAVACTQAIPATALAAEKRRGHLKVPLIGIITDFGVHSYWLHPEIDLYLVAHDDIRRKMIRRGISAKKIFVTGIPIHPSYGESLRQREERKRFKLHPKKKTVLLMGGSRGLGSLDELAHVLLKIRADFQCLIVCGRNKPLTKDMKRLTRGRPQFHVVGYEKRIASLMAAADILITKPGGLTCSEALARQLPLILINPIPGQEERNVQFLTKHNVARVARTPEKLRQTITDLLLHPTKIKRMGQNAKKIARPWSALSCAELIMDFIKK